MGTTSNSSPSDERDPLLKERKRLKGTSMTSVTATLSRKMSSTQAQPQPERTYESLEQVLQAYGTWNSFYIFMIAHVFLAWFLAETMTYIFFLLLPQIMKKRPLRSTLFCEDITEDLADFSILKKEVIRILPEWDDENLRPARMWGYNLGLSMLFVMQYWGRRVPGCVSLLVIAVCSIILCLGSPEMLQIQVISVVVAFAIMFVEFSFYMNVIEWMPSKLRPLVTCLVYATQPLCKCFVDVIVQNTDSFQALFLVVGILSVVFAIWCFWFFRDSPYYYLSKCQPDELQNCFELIERWTPASKIPAKAEKMVDDVAFEVFENYDSFVDVLWTAVTNWKIMLAEFTICFSIVLAGTIVNSVRLENTAYFPVNELSQNWFLNVEDLVAILLALLFIRKRRRFSIVLPFTLMGFCLTTLMLLPPTAYHKCDTDVQEGWRSKLVFGMVLICSLFIRAMDVFYMLFVTEYFPTAIRPLFVALPYIVVKLATPPMLEITNTMSNYVLYGYTMAPAFLCLAFIILILVSTKKKVRMHAYFADLQDEDKIKEKPDVPYPVLQTVPPSKSSDSDPTKSNSK